MAFSTFEGDTNHLLVAAIDFGTTYSGYAFSMKGNQEKIFMSKNWSEIGSVKTPTSVLTSTTGKFEAFGHQAEQRFSEAVSEVEPRVCLFQHFKMELHQLKKLSKRILVKSKDNRATLKAFELVTMALRYIKGHLMEELTKEGMVHVRPEDIRWVVTVPAIWTDASKRFMREAAFKAGLTGDVDSDQLLIALEPECAALYVRSLDAKNFAVETSNARASMPPGTKYMVVDIGGGTVDIAVHEVTGPRHAKELYYPTGGHWGGTRVNHSFENLMARILGAGTVQQLKDVCPHAWWELESRFEMMKRSWNEGARLNFSVSHELSTKYKELRKEAIDLSFGRAGIMFKQGHIRLESESVKAIFDESVNKIMAHLEGLLSEERVKDIQYMMLVGGYSESPYLQDVVRERFQGRVDILIPQEASIAVVKGAVMFGHHPGSIESRRAKRSYGVSTHVAFQRDLHKEDHRVVVEGKNMAKDVFNAFVRKDHEVDQGHVRHISFKPLHPSDSRVTFVLYEADREDVEYVDEEGVEEMSRLTLNLPVDNTSDRPIDMEVTFGGTEIQVKVTDQRDGLSQDGSLHFDTA